MSKFDKFMDKLSSSIWSGISIFVANGVCFAANLKLGASDWSYLANIFGLVFSVRIIYQWFQWREVERLHRAQMDKWYKEFIEWRQELHQAYEQDRKNHSDESNSDKT